MSINGIGAGAKIQTISPIQYLTTSTSSPQEQVDQEVISLIPNQNQVENDFSLAYPSWINNTIAWGTSLGVVALAGLWFIGRQANYKILQKHSRDFQNILAPYGKKLQTYDTARQAKLKESGLSSQERRRLKGDKLLAENQFMARLRRAKLDDGVALIMSYPVPDKECLKLVGMESLMESKGEPLKKEDREILNKRTKNLFTQAPPPPISGWFNAETGELSGLAPNSPLFHIKAGTRKVWNWLTRNNTQEKSSKIKENKENKTK